MTTELEPVSHYETTKRAKLQHREAAARAQLEEMVKNGDLTQEELADLLPQGE